MIFATEYDGVQHLFRRERVLAAAIVSTAFGSAAAVVAQSEATGAYAATWEDDAPLPDKFVQTTA